MTGDNPATTTPAPDERAARDDAMWRNEYPIDWPESEYVSRREFTRLLLLTSLAFVVGQAYIVVSSLLRQRANPPPATGIASVAQVPVKATLLFYYPTENDRA
ncbi:MAG: hypothetical protein M1570_06595 [Chloroflexi bacterium]|nr:hypothetical protein [Chloroflexota bacterium]